MTHEMLVQAVRAVEAASDEARDPEISARLARLADHLRMQAEREGTPALGGLDRIHHALQEVTTQTEVEAVITQVDDAQIRIVSFLDTLDDRGMKQHGLVTNTNANHSR